MTGGEHTLPSDAAAPPGQHGVLIESDLSSSTMLVCFGDVQPEAERWESRSVTLGWPVTRMYIRDDARAWYHRGAAGQDSNSGLARWIRNVSESRSLHRLVFTGSSAGYAAIVLGVLTHADEVVSGTERRRDLAERALRERAREDRDVINHLRPELRSQDVPR